MAILKRKELRELEEKELKEKLESLQQELRTERAKMATGGVPDNPGKMREVKKTIARLNTIAGERGYHLNE